MYSFIPNVIFGLFPEVIYFTLFLIYTKNYKDNKIKLFLLLLLGYVVLKFLLPANIYFQITFTLYVPVILKLLYKDKFHISDIFVFVYSSIVLIIITILTYPIALILNNYIIAYIINRFLMFLFIIFFKSKLNKIYKWVISQWNRNYEKPNKIKAITIRQVCVISLNVMIYALYLSVQILINS